MPSREVVILAARKAAQKHGVDPDVFVRQIGAESGYRDGQTSSAGARDIAQFIPSTAKMYGVTLGDGKIGDDLDGAARYMKDNLKRTGGNYREALSIYNSGRPDGYQRFGETRAYVKKIMEGQTPKAGAPSGGGGRRTPGTPATPGRPGFDVKVPITKDELDVAAYETARKRAVLAGFLERRDPNSLLLRSGAISSKAPDVRDFQRSVEGEQTVKIPGAPGTPASAGSPSRGGSGGGGGASSAVNFARERIGRYAESAGSNRGPHLDTLQKRFGFNGAAWCAMFTSVAVTAGGAPKAARTASVAEVRRQAEQGGGGYEKGLKSTPKPGDLIIYGQGSHIGIVESVDGDTVTTIEGNTSAGKVARRTNPIGAGQYARPKYSA